MRSVQKTMRKKCTFTAGRHRRWKKERRQKRVQWSALISFNVRGYGRRWNRDPTIGLEPWKVSQKYICICPTKCGPSGLSYLLRSCRIWIAKKKHISSSRYLLRIVCILYFERLAIFIKAVNRMVYWSIFFCQVSYFLYDDKNNRQESLVSSSLKRAFIRPCKRSSCSGTKRCN